MNSSPSGTPASEPAPFFIVGNERSGTTMLRLIMDRSAQVSLPTESMFIGDYASVRKGRIDLSDHAAARDFAREVWSHPRVKLWNLPGEAPTPPEGLTHADAYRFAIEAPYRAFADRDGKAMWGDKTPAYIHWVDEIKAIWPEAKFVELVRDGRDVSLSIQALPFGGNNAWVTGTTWAEGIRAGRDAAQRYPDDVLTLRYEDLTAQPEQHIRRICDFLSLQYSDAMLAIEEVSPDRVVADQKDWFTQVWNGINQGSVEKWRRKMSRREQRNFLRVARPELELYGYDPGENLPRRGSRLMMPVSALINHAHNTVARTINFIRLHLIQERGREVTWVLRRKLTRS